MTLTCQEEERGWGVLEGKSKESRLTRSDMAPSSSKSWMPPALKFLRPCLASGSGVSRRGDWKRERSSTIRFLLRVGDRDGSICMTGVLKKRERERRRIKKEWSGPEMRMNVCCVCSPKRQGLEIGNYNL